jgi:AmmeMemoRadiSam system protein B
MAPALDLRPSPIAGRWYSDDPRRLADSIDAYLGQARLPEIPGDVIAVMTPHAGHMYSGHVAGYAFAALQGLRPGVVAVVSPMHYPTPSSVLTSAHQAYVTPLGELMIDQQALQRINQDLQESLGFGLAPVRNDQEHSLEIELPFLQRSLKGEFLLLPLMVRDPDPEIAQALGLALAKELAGRNALLVASTDLSHGKPQPTANTFDAEILRLVERLDPAGILLAEQQGTGFACGRGALAAVLWAALGLGANEACVLNYATSGAVTGDYAQVVGYGSAAIYRKYGAQD